MNSLDSRGYSALHRAAESGSIKICRALIESGAIITLVESRGAMTPCEIASQAGHQEAACYLEAASLYDSKSSIDMSLSFFDETIFDDQEGGCGRRGDAQCWFVNVTQEEVNWERSERIQEAFMRLRKTEAKISHAKDNDDNVVGATAGALIDKETTSIMLAAAAWNVKDMLQRYEKEGEKFLAFCKIASAEKIGKVSPQEPSNDAVYECPICTEDFARGSEDFVILPSQHCHDGFCADCLSAYIASSAATGSGLVIDCPHHDCDVLLDEETVKAHSTAEVWEKLKSAECDAFVASAWDFTHCPVNNCQCVVRHVVPTKFYNRWGPQCLEFAPAVCSLRSSVGGKTTENDTDIPREDFCDPQRVSSTLRQPALAHRFCWSCKKAPHWPVPCDMLAKWSEKVELEVGQPDAEEAGKGNPKTKGDGSEETYEEVSLQQRPHEIKNARRNLAN